MHSEESSKSQSYKKRIYRIIKILQILSLLSGLINPQMQFESLSEQITRYNDLEKYS